MSTRTDGPISIRWVSPWAMLALSALPSFSNMKTSVEGLNSNAALAYPLFLKLQGLGG